MKSRLSASQTLRAMSDRISLWMAYASSASGAQKYLCHTPCLSPQHRESSDCNWPPGGYGRRRVWDPQLPSSAWGSFCSFQSLQTCPPQISNSRPSSGRAAGFGETKTIRTPSSIGISDTQEIILWYKHEQPFDGIRGGVAKWFIKIILSQSFDLPRNKLCKQKRWLW